MASIGWRLHHVGLLTQSLDETRQAYLNDFGAEAEGEPVAIDAQKVRVALLRLADGTRLELVEPLEAGSTLDRLAGSGNRLYHLGFEVENLKVEVEAYAAKGYHALPAFTSELFDDRRCQFLFGPEQALFELIER
jgi:catechol 2,3-dioxygenase-like lactoylglutathione lyase family enzyme